LSACGGSKEVEILDVYFSTDQSEEGLNTRTNEFISTDTINLNIDVDGNPDEGNVLVDFYFNEMLISSVGYEFPIDDISKGDSHLYFTLESDNPFGISKNYHAVVSVNDEEYGVYDFMVVPPESAIPSQITDAAFYTLDSAAGDFVESDVYSKDEIVSILVTGDYGQWSWFETLWYRGDYKEGDLIADCGMAGQYPENLNGEQFIDSCIPEDGWEIGTYEVLIYLDDEIAGTYPFTIE
jgi:hypothetical protein